MAFDDVLVHTAVPVRRRVVGEPEPDTWVEGQRISGDWAEGALPAPPEKGTPFACCLFLPEGTETSAGRGRQVRQPTLLFGLEDELGGTVGLSPRDELLIVAPELNVGEGLPPDQEVRWQVAGSPQPFGKPGADVIGFQATLQRVDD